MNMNDSMRLIRFTLLSLGGTAVAVLILTKLYQAPMTLDLMNIDYSDILAVLVAFFAIGLSVMFYIKSSETSNRFYDNTYRFTKDISETLGRMDERFGERLQALRENYTSLQQDIRTIPFNLKDAEAKAKLAEEEAGAVELDKVRILEELIDKAKLGETEKKRYIEAIKEKDDELQSLRDSLKAQWSRIQEYIPDDRPFVPTWARLPLETKSALYEYVKNYQPVSQGSKYHTADVIGAFERIAEDTNLSSFFDEEPLMDKEGLPTALSWSFLKWIRQRYQL